MLPLVLSVVESRSRDDDGLRVLALGDWGGIPNAPYSTGGERLVAEGMGQLAVEYDAKYVFAMGDNFYDHGIPADEHDPRFQETFETVFNASSLQIPWYVIGGNHDHLGNITAQIEYSNDSKRWNYPSSWYSQSWTFTDKGKEYAVELIMIDTVVLSGDSYEPDEQPWDPFAGEFINVKGPVDQVLADAQWTFIENALHKSTADYLFVGGHYPIYSTCEHGPTKKLIEQLLPIMKAVNATGYIAGHDHCLGHYEDDGIIHILTGAGHNCCYSPKNLNNVPEGSTLFRMDSETRTTVHPGHGAQSGFSLLNFTGNGMTVTYYDDVVYPLYTTRLVKPRSL